MESKIYLIVISSSTLVFALIAAGISIPAFAQEDDTGMTQGEDMGDMNGDMGGMNQSQGNDTGMVQGQSNEAKNDGNNEEEEGDDE
jgi:hypothetical protein